MVFEGKVYKDKGSKWWISEVAALQAMTQGTSKADAIYMLKDWIRTALDKPNYKVDIEAHGNDLIVRVPTTPEIISLMLQRLRTRRGLTVREASKLMGFKSHNAYAQYERGTIEPKLSQLERFLHELKGETELKIKFG